jgi:hypothetical protein
MTRNFDWSAPAQLFFWPAAQGGDEHVVYPTLSDAVQAAGEGDGPAAWIITQNGEILPPRLIETLRRERPWASRGRRPTALFPWARAA